MANLGDLLVHLGLDSSSFEKGMSKIKDSIKGAGKNLGKMGDSFKDVGGKMTAGLTLPIAGIGIAVTKLAVDFEAGMSEVQAISGATGEDLVKLEAKAKEMGATTKFSAVQSAEAMKYMALSARAVTGKLVA